MGDESFGAESREKKATLQARALKVKEILRIPAAIRVVELLPIGYPAEPAPAAKRRRLLPLTFSECIPATPKSKTGKPR